LFELFRREELPQSEDKETRIDLTGAEVDAVIIAIVDTCSPQGAPAMTRQ
jgi:hypothetical protein